ncbi:hypothetical protein NKJ26_17320 [Mesorhizobium sp. M0152]|uniref:hypothetical protein n=1 Tax=unclassified Mesorhizobium TaxID=325217 RepID=UPI00333A9FE7
MASILLKSDSNSCPAPNLALTHLCKGTFHALEEFQAYPGANMRKTSLHLLKGAGYLISTISVALLTIVSWQNASKDLMLTVCLLAGAATSVIGMFCRWLSYEIEKRQADSFRINND